MKEMRNNKNTTRGGVALGVSIVSLITSMVALILKLLQ